MRLEGVWTALVTPLRDGRLDESSLRAVVKRQIEGGVAGLVPCGTTGESATLADDEHRRVIEVVVDESGGRVPVVAGAGTASTQKTIKLCESARAAGAEGVLVVCPYYNRPTRAGLVAHFERVCGAVDLPVMLYNVPRRTGADMGLDVLEALAHLPQITSIKEATGNVERAQDILLRFGDRFAVFAGDDWVLLGAHAVGACGVVSVTANVKPQAVSHVHRLLTEGRWDEARKLHFRLMPLHRAMFVEASPAPVKAALQHLKVCSSESREPIVPVSPSAERLITDVLERIEDLS